MHPPFTRFTALRTVKAALEDAAHCGIHQHAEETYQGSDRQEQRTTACDGSGARNEGSSYHRSSTAGRSDTATSTGSHLLARPEQSGRNPAVGSHGSSPGVGCGSGESGGHQPELQIEIGCHDSCHRCRPAVGVHLPGVAPVPLGVYPRVIGSWSQA